MRRFTLRDSLLVTAIVALAVGWWLDNRHKVDLLQRNEADRQQIAKELLAQKERSDTLDDSLRNAVMRSAILEGQIRTRARKE
jgi:hypothetical protein